jgi:hypothetical protein
MTTTVAPPTRHLPTRIGLLALAAGGLWVGAWATFAPQSFYDDFPGFGRHWVAMDGAYNQHLISDVGGLNLALGVITVVAAINLAPAFVRAVAVGWLVYSVPHLLYHATHLHGFDGSDQVMNIVSLSFNVVVPVLVLIASVWTWPARHPSAAPEVATTSGTAVATPAGSARG